MTAPPADNVRKAAAVLKNGGVAVLPTDTLYALVADARDARAVRRVYEIKQREDGKPLPLFVAGLDAAAHVGQITDLARSLTTSFWPGALTIVLDRRPDFDSEALAGGATVALRAPNHELLLQILREVDAPLTGTSANRSGGSDPISAEAVRDQIGDEADLLIDGGITGGGVASTIVDCRGAEPIILRQGAIPEADVRAAARGQP